MNDIGKIVALDQDEGPSPPTKAEQAKYMMWGVHSLIEQRRFDEAFNLACLVLWVEKENHKAHNAIGICLRQDRNYDGAVDALETALKHAPEDGRFMPMANLASIKLEIGPYAEGLAALEKIVAEKPELDIARMAFMSGTLASGNLAKGWPLYKQRREYPQFNAQIGQYPLPMWDGKTKERVIVAMEEGPGERIMFSSMIPDMIRAGATPIIDCSQNYSSMGTLFKRSFPGCEIAGFGEGVRAKSQVIVGDLGGFYRNSFDDFPKAPFLKPNPARVRELRKLIDREAGTKHPHGNIYPKSGPVIGISWHSAGRGFGEVKSIPLYALAPLWGIKGARFVDLQYGDHEAERKASYLYRVPGVDVTKDFDDLAALCKACDLVITISNSVAHVAGGVGVPTWLLTPGAYGRHWFWFTEREDSPWYPSMRIFRQNWREGWGTTIDRVETELIRFIS